MNKVLAVALALGLAGAAAWLALGAGDNGAATEASVGPAPAASANSTTVHPAAATPAKADEPAGPAKPAAANATSAPDEPKDDASILDQSGRAQLAQGIEARRDGRSIQARELFESAATALGQSITMTGEHVDPWTLQSMAQTQLELGNDVDAIGWADRAMQRMRAGGGDDYETFRAATLTMNVGIVYFRAGQRQTGIAYMDQAISMAPTAFDREDFADLKQETISGDTPPT